MLLHQEFVRTPPNTGQCCALILGHSSMQIDIRSSAAVAAVMCCTSSLVSDENV